MGGRGRLAAGGAGGVAPCVPSHARPRPGSSPATVAAEPPHRQQQQQQQLRPTARKRSRISIVRASCSRVGGPRPRSPAAVSASSQVLSRGPNRLRACSRPYNASSSCAARHTTPAVSRPSDLHCTPRHATTPAGSHLSDYTAHNATRHATTPAVGDRGSTSHLSDYRLQARPGCGPRAPSAKRQAGRVGPAQADSIPPTSRLASSSTACRSGSGGGPALRLPR